VVDGRLVAQAGIGTAQFGRHPGMTHGEALDMDLVDNRVRVPVLGPGTVPPREGLLGHHQAAWHAGRRIRITGRVGVARRVSEHLGTERDITGERARVRIQQELGQVTADAVDRVPGPGGPVPADGAAEAARPMIAALRERDWEGDDALADQLDALLEGGAMPDLRPLPVDLDELAGILEGDPMYGGGRVDLATGEVWPAPAVDYAREIGQEDEDESEDPDKWLWVHCEGSRDGYRDMEMFIGTVRDPGRADRLEIAISGRGAFRRFKDVLERWPGKRVPPL